MTTLLFLSTGEAARSQMAAAFARAQAPEGVEVIAAVMAPPGQADPLAREVMREKGFDLSQETVKLFVFPAAGSVDVVITMGEEVSDACCLSLPGHPSQVEWHVDDEDLVSPDRAKRAIAFKKTCDRIEQLVGDLFNHGYLESLAWANSKAALILNSMSEGIIAHDMNRTIVFFNGTAERITGYSRQEVIGSDCHDVFPGNFCGPKCAFCDECDTFDRTTYAVDLTTRSGEIRKVEMSVQAIKGEGDKMLGVLASFRDLTREHDMARRLGKMQSFAGIIGRDKKMLEVFDLIRSVAESNVPVLVGGASGTGKELVAAAIHNEGSRRDGLFVPVNCGALPEGLLESELFGHVRGAFTGATRDKKGRFELADKGTIFLDEIGDITPAMQVKLLRVLQEGTFERVGDSRTQTVDVRVISATNRDLKEEIAAGRFREDLYYRLCVVPIHLPPLCERCGDIPLLVDHILERVASECGREGAQLSPAALDALLSYEWPGNIRELQNVLQFSMVKCQCDLIEVTDLPPHIINTISRDGRLTRTARPIVPGGNCGAEREQAKRGGGQGKLNVEIVREALRQCAGNKVKASRLLGVGRATLYRFLGRHPDLISE